MPIIRQQFIQRVKTCLWTSNEQKDGGEEEGQTKCRKVKCSDGGVDNYS